MKKLIAFVAFIVVGKYLLAQPLNNEWIDFNKIYYKFKVGATGLYRINQTTLASVGLGNVNVQEFQLWRNGVQVPIFTSIATGQFSTSDYIEFWGQMNDGKLDKFLYKKPNNQLSDKLSLQTDTAAYFLTTNNSANLRFTNVANNIVGNTLAAETNFTYSFRINFKERVNRGYAVNYVEDIYSSTYDVAEFLSSKDITIGNGSLNIPLSGLYMYPTGSTATLYTGFAGNSAKIRSILLNINNTTFINKSVSGYDASINTANIPLATFNGTTDVATIKIISNNNDSIYDRVVASFFELQYPRSFNFGGNSNFEFQMPAAATAKYLEINNFNTGLGVAPVLYDIVNNQYFVGDITIAGLVRFVLPPSTATQNFVLVSKSSSNINIISNLQKRSFNNYNTLNNQADYLIISNKVLESATDQYKQYRSSGAGGGFTANVFDIDELEDQFAFGIKKHPLSVRNFLRFANASFAVKPKFVFFIGKGVAYDQYRFLQNKPEVAAQNLVPTFGWPASDAMLVSPDNSEPAPIFPFGRLSAITVQEVIDYLNKIKEYEQQPNNGTQTIASKAWMKQLVHVAGGKDDGENDLFTYYLKGYERIITDTSFGGKVINFNKTTGGETDNSIKDQMKNLFKNGIGLLTFFGHSAASGLSYNLNDPNDYSNQSKYPVFLVNGCTAGNIFDYDADRTVNINNVSERWVLYPNKGSIAFIATTHFGFTGHLDVYTTGFYNHLSKVGYGKSIGENMMAGLARLKAVFSFSDAAFLGKTHGEQFDLHGDPAVQIYNFAKPDFVVEDDQVLVSPQFISVLDKSFKIKANIFNIGKSVGDSVNVLITRKYPNGTIKDTSIKILSTRFEQTIEFDVAIDVLRDKGTNTLTVSVDNNNLFNEISENNNSITKQFVVYEDGLQPVYPPNYSIVNKAQVKLIATTANPFTPTNQYTMEFDTTALFNSAFKITKTIASVGGALEFDASVIFKDSTVYFWRVSPVPSNGVYRWNNSSFVYLQNATTSGYNQSHFYQHTESSLNNLVADTLNRKFDFPISNQTFTIHNGVYPYNGSDGGGYSIAINDAINPSTQGIGDRPHNIVFTVYNPSTLKEMFNAPAVPFAPGQYGSLAYAGSGVPGMEYDFAYAFNDTTGRKAAMNFMDNIIPDGSYVVVRNIILDIPTSYGIPAYANTWKQDENYFGAGNSLYQHLKNAGFADIDSFNRMRAFAFMYQKNKTSFAPVWAFTKDSLDMLTLKTTVKTKPNNGFIVSPKFGPAAKWYNMLWTGNKTDLDDIMSLKLIGIKTDNTTDTLQTYTELQTNNSIANIDAAFYPYLKLYIDVKDTTNQSAYQLKYWRLLADLLPEGALAPNVNFSFKDTLQIGEPQQIAIAFKNISGVDYGDSLDVDLKITNANNTTQTIVMPKVKKLLQDDTATIKVNIATENLVGNNVFFVNVNPSNKPKEENLSNNFAYRNFFVIADDKNPILDVTFDGVHILNQDIVSSKPHIRIALKDESKYMLLNDTSLLTIKLKTPSIDAAAARTIKYDNDTLTFIPANSATGNKAVVEFNPTLLEDGDYELFIESKDRSNNAAGPKHFEVAFSVNNKPMISNVFNYPNPFTTSTAFVFTLTGSTIPNNIKIQILTVTGKVIREITKNELGNLHIGRNITDFKWDGTDSFGQALGNGVYLYRVVTSLDGKSLDKYNIDDTDKYFKAGYGKMYLMR